MIKTLVVDDEKSIRTALKQKLVQFFKQEIEVVGESASIVETVQLIKVKKPDLVLFDIELTDGTSFEVFKQLKTDAIPFQFFFITGFNDKAIQAIKLGALDYIVKPFSDDEFIEAVQKALKRLAETAIQKEQVAVSQSYYSGDTQNKRLVLKTFESHHIINEKDIVYCKSEGNYTTFYLKNKENILISKSLKKSKALLSDSLFIQTHQSYLVNKNFIKQNKPEGFLILQANIKIPIAQRRRDYVCEIISKL